MLQNVCFEFLWKKGYWNFHTAGHGKYIPDGIGASLKRAADIRVKHGEDVVSASQFIKQMHKSGSKVEVYQIQEQDIKEIERKVKDKNLNAIPGPIKIHQLTTEQSEEVKLYFPSLLLTSLSSSSDDIAASVICFSV
jgi:hypothetical protein